MRWLDTLRLQAAVGIDIGGRLSNGFNDGIIRLWRNCHWRGRLYRQRNTVSTRRTPEIYCPRRGGGMQWQANPRRCKQPARANHSPSWPNTARVGTLWFML